MGQIISKLNLNKTPRLVDNNSLIFAKNIKLLKDGSIGRDDSIYKLELQPNNIINHFTDRVEDLNEQLSVLTNERDELYNSLKPAASVSIIYDSLYEITNNFTDYSDITIQPFTDLNEDLDYVLDVDSSKLVETLRDKLNHAGDITDPLSIEFATDANEHEITLFFKHSEDEASQDYKNLEDFLGTNIFRIPVFVKSGIIITDIFKRYYDTFLNNNKVVNFDYTSFVSELNKFKTHYSDIYNNCFTEIEYVEENLEYDGQGYNRMFFQDRIFKAYYYKFLDIYNSISNDIIIDKEKEEIFKSTGQKQLQELNDKIKKINRRINVLNKYIDLINDDNRYKIVGIIPYNTCFYVFYSNDNVSSYSSFIIKYDELTEQVSLCNCNWTYSGGKIDGIVMRNLRGDEILNICEYGVDGALIPLKSINLSISDVEDDETVYTQVPLYPQTNFLLYSKFPFSIPIGTYQFFVRYEISEEVYTNWYPATEPISIGTRRKKSMVGGVIYFNDVLANSPYSFVFRVQHLNENATQIYKRFQIGFLLSTENSQIARAWKHFSFSANNHIIYFTALENEVKEIPVDDLLEPIYNIYNVKNIVTFKNKLYISNYSETNFNLDFNEYARNIKIDIKSKIKSESDNGIVYKITYPIHLTYGIDDLNVAIETIILNEGVISGIYNIDYDSAALNTEICPLGSAVPFAITTYNISDLIYNFLYFFNRYSDCDDTTTTYIRDSDGSAALHHDYYVIECDSLDDLVETQSGALGTIRKHENDYLHWSHVYGIYEEGTWKYPNVFSIDSLIQLFSDSDIANYDSVIRWNAADFTQSKQDLYEVYQNVKGGTIYLKCISADRTSESISDNDIIREFTYEGIEEPIDNFQDFIISISNYMNNVNAKNGNKINFTYTIKYPGTDLNVYTFVFSLQIYISLDLITQTIELGDLNNTTLLPLQTYKFYVHYINSIGEITNGYFIKEITVPCDENTKKHYKYYPSFKNITYPSGYESCFFSLVHTGTNVSEIFGIRLQSPSHLVDRTYVVGNSLDLDTGLIKTPDNIELVFIKDENNYYTTDANHYHHSSDTDNKFFLGQTGCVDIHQPTNIDIIKDEDYNVFARFKYNKEEDDYVLLKCTPIINEENYDSPDNITLPGYICNVTKPIARYNDGKDYYCKHFVSGNDVYTKSFSEIIGDNDEYIMSLNSVKFDNDLARVEAIYTIYSNFNLNNLSLRYDIRDVIQLKDGSETENDTFSILDSLTISDMYELKSMYFNYLFKSYIEYDNKVLSEFNNTIRSSITLGDESVSNKYSFRSTDTYNTPVDKGEIVKMFTTGNNIFVHTKDTLYVFSGDNTLSSAGGDTIQLSESDVFNTGIKAVLAGEFGFAGIREKHHGIITIDSYIFYDADGKNIYIYEGKGLVRISDEIYKLLNAYDVHDVIFANDIKNNRIFIGIYIDKDFINLSYDLTLKRFISLHDFKFTDSFSTKISLYMMNSNVSENTLYSFNKRVNDYTQYGDLSYQGIIYPNYKFDDLSGCVVDVIANENYDRIKTLDFIDWICNKIKDYNNEETVIDNKFAFVAEEGLEPFAGDKIQIYTDSCASDIIDLSSVQNDSDINDLNSYKKVRYNLGEWTLNYLRNILNANSKYNSDNRSLIYGKYFVARFIFNPKNNFKLETIRFDNKIIK